MENTSTNKTHMSPSVRRTAFIVALLVEYLLLIRVLFATSLSVNVADMLFSLLMLVFTVTLSAAFLPFFLKRQISTKRGTNALLKGVLTVAIFLAAFIIGTLLLAATLWIILTLANR